MLTMTKAALPRDLETWTSTHSLPDIAAPPSQTALVPDAPLQHTSQLDQIKAIEGMLQQSLSRVTGLGCRQRYVHAELYMKCQAAAAAVDVRLACGCCRSLLSPHPCPPRLLHAGS
jgi:hypothetical protein